MPPSNVKTVPFNELAKTLNTGDIVLFTGATSSGAVIRLFDNAEFSHVGLVSNFMLSCYHCNYDLSKLKNGILPFVKLCVLAI